MPLRNPDVEIPSITSALRDPEAAQLLDLYSNSFTDKAMTPTTIEGGLGQSYAFSIGNQTEIADRPFGMLGSVSYSRNISAYDNGASGIWKRVSRESEGLNRERFATDIERVRGSALGQPGECHVPAEHHPRNRRQPALQPQRREGCQGSRRGSGPPPCPATTCGTRPACCPSSSARCGPCSSAANTSFRPCPTWKSNGPAPSSGRTQDEPDLRYFTNEYRMVDAEGHGAPEIDSYTIALSNYAAPTRYFQEPGRIQPGLQAGS